MSFGLSFFDGGFAAVEGPAGGGASMDVVLLFSLGGLAGLFCWEVGGPSILTLGVGLGFLFLYARSFLCILFLAGVRIL